MRSHHQDQCLLTEFIFEFFYQAAMLCFFSRFANTSFESFGPRPGPDQGHISTQILQHLHENEASFYLNSAICKFSENAAFRITTLVLCNI